MKPNQRRAGLSWFPPRRAESILRSGLPKMGPTVPLGDNFRCPETRVLAPTTCDGLRNQRCPSRNPWPADKRTTPLRSPSHWRNVTRRSPFEKNTGKRNLRGPGVASRLQLCGIASTAHPPVCTSRRENAFVATGCFNIYSAVSDWCCAQFSQMFVSLFTGFRWQRRAQCELIQIDWRVAAIICLPPPPTSLLLPHGLLLTDPAPFLTRGAVLGMVISALRAAQRPFVCIDRCSASQPISQAGIIIYSYRLNSTAQNAVGL